MSASENQIVVYQPNETVRLDVRLENKSMWLSQYVNRGERAMSDEIVKELTHG